MIQYRYGPIVAFAALIMIAAAATPMAGPPTYDLSWHTMDDSGGGTSTGGPFELSGTIGQHDAAGPMTGGGFELAGGFWPAVGFEDCNGNGIPDNTEAASAFADLDNDGDVDAFDFLTFSNCFNGSLNPPQPGCASLCADIDGDRDVDAFDFLTFSNCFNGSLNPPACP